MSHRLARWVAGGALLWGLLHAAPSHAYTCIVSSCPVWCDEAVYALATSSVDLGEATTVEEVQRGMDDWSLVACTGLQTQYTGRTDASPSASGDGLSVIGWVHSDWRHSSNAIGVTGPRWDFSGCIVEADMEMNGVHYTWTTDPGSGSQVNAYSIILHEGGHYYGLGHSEERDAAMYFAYGGGVLSLHEDDREGICTLYPGPDDPDPGCGHDGDCPEGEVCDTGTGECHPDPDPDPPGCSDDGDCPEGEVCDTGTGECHEEPGGDLPLGAPCDQSPQCESGLCAVTADGSVCTQPCDPFAASSCPTGFYCATDGSRACNEGLCLAGTPGPGDMGDACTHDTDCASLLCEGGTCGERCVPGEGGCPEGFECRAGTSPDCGACREVVQAGDPCMVDEDCDDGVCLEPEEGGEPYCTTPCEDDRDCPEGYWCRTFGAASVCERDRAAPSGDAGVAPAAVQRLEGECGCAVPGAPGGPPMLLGAALVLFVAGRMRAARRLG